MPLFIPTAPSISVSIIAEVPMTILFSDKSLSWTACRSPGRIFQILPVEFMQIRFIGKITGTDFAFFVFYNGVHCYRVVLYELIPHRKDVKFLIFTAALPIQ